VCRAERPATEVTDGLICRDEACGRCEAPARHLTCADCGAEGIVTDCGHKAQPRPIAAAADNGDPVCDACWAKREAAGER
jgi:hypothetical protein